MAVERRGRRRVVGGCLLPLAMFFAVPVVAYLLVGLIHRPPNGGWAGDALLGGLLWAGCSALGWFACLLVCIEVWCNHPGDVVDREENGEERSGGMGADLTIDG